MIFYFDFVLYSCLDIWFYISRIKYIYFEMDKKYSINYSWLKIFSLKTLRNPTKHKIMIIKYIWFDHIHKNLTEWNRTLTLSILFWCTKNIIFLFRSWMLFWQTLGQLVNNIIPNLPITAFKNISNANSSKSKIILILFFYCKLELYDSNSRMIQFSMFS